MIYHGAEPCIPFIDKKEARKRLALPENGRIALLNGFLTSTKSWDIVRKMEIPDGWTIVMNHSRFHYSRERIDIKKDYKNNKIISLNKNYMSDPEFSLLLFASDIVLLPYKVSSGYDGMFDALVHGIPLLLPI